MGTTIKIKCIDQTLTYEGTPIVASGGVNEDYIQFEFGPLWDDFSKVAVFYRKKGEIYYGLVSTDNTVVVPKEVTEAKIADGRKSYPLKTKRKRKAIHLVFSVRYI